MTDLLSSSVRFLVRVRHVKPLRLLVRKRVGYVRPLRMGPTGVRVRVRIKYGDAALDLVALELTPVTKRMCR